MGVFSDPFDSLLEDFQETARPQREWVDGRGLLLIAGHFLSGVGAGGWVLASALGSWPGEVASLAVAAASGLAHLLFLGRPSRFWRMVRIRTSWVGRGFLGLNLLLVSGVLYLALRAAGAAGGALGSAVWGVSLAGAGVVMLYKGNVYAVCRAIPFWNSSLLPVLYVAYALRGGAALLLLLLPWAPLGGGHALVELLELWIGLSAGVCILFYVTIMARSSVGARRSVEDLLRGRVAAAFYAGVVGVGLAIPLAIGALNAVTPVSLGALAVVGTASLVGDFYVKYAIAKAGRYRPHLHASR